MNAKSLVDRINIWQKQREKKEGRISWADVAKELSGELENEWFKSVSYTTSQSLRGLRRVTPILAGLLESLESSSQIETCKEDLKVIQDSIKHTDLCLLQKI